MNETLVREGLEAYFDGTGRSHVRAGYATSAGRPQERRPWTKKDIERRQAWEAYLSTASEDEFTERVLLALLQLLGFSQVVAAGHRDKALEYGKDVWMKLQLPTSHWIYFAIQVKKGRIDSAGKTKGNHENITEVLNQVRMALESPIFDAELNKKVLLDHVYVVATGEITKQAKAPLAESLDNDSRRTIIFMERSEIIDLAVMTGLPIPSSETQDSTS